MFIYLGEDTVISANEIVAMINLDNSNTAELTREFFGIAQKKGEVVTINEELPRSAVVCEKDGKKTVYISQISTSTLKQRLGFGDKDFYTIIPGETYEEDDGGLDDLDLY